MKRLAWAMAGLVGFPLTLSAVGCAPSGDEIQHEFAAFVDSVNHCSETVECVLTSPGCPLGCHIAVPLTARSRVDAKARELIDDYESSGEGCVYSCIQPGEVACREGRCHLE